MSTGMCRPNKGDLVETASALYLLFCGDMLRACSNKSDAKDGAYHTFQVQVLEFLKVAIDPSSAPGSSSSSSEDASTVDPAVSFIQVCRNHARPSFKDMFSPSSLEWLYNAACACYCYDCCPAIDLYAPIRYVKEGKACFVPLVVSVKARRTMSPAERTAALAAMKEVVEEGPKKLGICVLFIIGLNEPESDETGFYNDKGEKIDTPNKLDMSLISYVQVSVPSDDVFGLSDVVTQTTVDCDAKTEVYTSHGFLHAHSLEKDTSKITSLLRTKAKKAEKNYLKELCEAFGSVKDGN
jgi:hypothetical protein